MQFIAGIIIKVSIKVKGDEFMVEFNAKIKNHMIIVIGATGELMRKKLLPALYRLYERGIISQTMPIVCVGRKKLTKNSYIDLIEPEKVIPDVNNMILSGFLQLIHYIRSDFENGDLGSFCSTIDKLDKKNNCRGNKIFYFATPQALYTAVSDSLSEMPFMKGRGWKRVVYENPYGESQKHADELNKMISKCFDENQMYRVSHYVDKRVMDDLMAFRFGNLLLKNAWDSKFVDNVQITLSEKEGVSEDGRKNFFFGVVKNMFLMEGLQLLSFAGMDEPRSMTADDIRGVRLRSLKALADLNTKDVVVGQYGSGKIDGGKVKGYRQEEGTVKDSKIETYFAAKFTFKKGGLKNIPVYVRCGKRLKADQSRIDLVLKEASGKIFENKSLKSNVITMLASPESGLGLSLNNRLKGDAMKVEDFNLDSVKGKGYKVNTPEAYESIIYDVMKGDMANFSCFDEIKAGWKIVEPLVEIVKRKKVKFPNYSAGNDGPKDSVDLLKKDKRAWQF